MNLNNILKSGYRVILHKQEILHIEKKALGMTSLLIKWKEGAESVISWAKWIGKDSCICSLLNH